MGRIALTGAALTCALSTAGCADLVTVLRDGETVATTGAIRRGQKRPMLAGPGAALQVAGGPNRVVGACREAVQAEAVKLGARSVEAVSAGPEHRNRQGQTVGPVHVRIAYGRMGSLEVREATISCVVDRSGRVVGVFTGRTPAAGV